MNEGGAVELRERMVSRLRKVPLPVAEAMRRVPRERYVPEAYRSQAYDDTPIPLPFGEATVSAPHMVALQLEYAALRPGLRVLEIGAGFGYLTALLAELVGPAGRVFAVEVEPALTIEARRRLAEGTPAAPVEVRNGDGRFGWPEAAPFDRILVACAVGEVPDVWRSSLAPGGVLVAPLGDAFGQRLARWRREGDSGSWEYGVPCRFVPMRALLPSDI